MYSEFYLKNLNNCTFGPSTSGAISISGLSVLEKTKNSFKVMSSKKFPSSTTYNIEFDDKYNLKKIAPLADNITTINLLFCLANYSMNPLLKNLNSENFAGADDEYLDSFIKELVSCNLSGEKLLLCLNFLAKSSNKSDSDLLKTYFKYLEKYYLFDQLLDTCNETLIKSKNKEIRQAVIAEFFFLISTDEKGLSTEQIAKINSLIEKFSDEEFLSILKNEVRSNMLLTSSFNFSNKLESLVKNEKLITLDELIKILPSTYVDKIVNNESLTYFGLTLYLSKKTKQETESYLTKHFVFYPNSVQELFENYQVVDLICENAIYTPFLNALSRYVEKSRHPMNIKYNNALNLLYYMVDKHSECKTNVCKYITEKVSNTFYSIFNCLVDNDTKEDRATIYNEIKANLLLYCPTKLVSKILFKLNSYYRDYLAMLYEACGDDESLKMLFLNAILNSDYPINDLIKNQENIDFKSIIKTPLIILLKRSGKLDKLGIKKVDL